MVGRQTDRQAHRQTDRYLYYPRGKISHPETAQQLGLEKDTDSENYENGGKNNCCVQ